MRAVSILFSGIFSLATFAMLAYKPSDTIRTIPSRKAVYRAANTRSSDIIHTKLNVKFDWNKSQMLGEASIIAKPYFKTSDKLILDARGMEIQLVEVYEYSNQKNTSGKLVDNIPSAMKLNSSFTYKNDSININLGRQFTSAEKYLVKIKYIAKPEEVKGFGSQAITDDKGLYFINPKGKEKNKMPQIWTQGETQSSSAWFPTIDSPNEKMTNEIFMTVDDKYTTLSNGVLSESKKNGDGTRTDHWTMDQPHSPYLLMMGVGEFKKVVDEPWNGKEISYYVEKEYEPYAKEIFGNTKEMIEFFSKALGTPYPWPKYSQIVVRDYVSGAMENTSATLHGDFMVYQTSREMLDGKKGEDVISHELFHQWFGDLVTAESWSNLPLNESFATYGEYLWQEYKNGRDAADAHSYQSRAGYFTSSAYGNEVDMIRFHYNDKEDMFDAFSYNKGGQILHMLRKYVGDEAFFASLKLYLEKNKFKSAEIHDLRLAFEEITGEDLNWFFNEWFLAKGHPELEIIKTYDAANKQVKLKIKQKQNLREAPLYTLPVDVDLYVNGKVQRKRIIISQSEQEFLFNVNTEPDLVNFDAERQLLHRRRYNKTIKEYIYQYNHAPLFSDRLEAIEALAENVKSMEAYDVLLQAAKNDKWSGLRETAINYLKPVAKEKESELKPLLMKIATEDKNTSVRSATNRILGENYSGKDIENLLIKQTNEQSYYVIASAIQAMGSTNGVEAMALADKFSNEKNATVTDAVASVYSLGGSEKNLPYFQNRIHEFSDNKVFDFFYYYAELVKRCNSYTAFQALFNDVTQLVKSENKGVARFMKNFLKDEFLPVVTEKAKTGEAGFKDLKDKVTETVK
ncbi:MAG: aminopeptidase 1-like [Bacteroidetes bacterium]|jgi:aminopeptidase N|nr:aminopeptidase 1-like [Bacteroidota bacterium]